MSVSGGHLARLYGKSHGGFAQCTELHAVAQPNSSRGYEYGRLVQAHNCSLIHFNLKMVLQHAFARLRVCSYKHKVCNSLPLWVGAPPFMYKLDKEQGVRSDISW